MLLVRMFLALFPAAVLLAAAPSSPQLQRNYGELPLRFEPLASPGQFQVRGHGYLLQLDRAGFTIQHRDSAIRARLAGANPRAVAHTEDQLPGATHYFLGDPRQWRANVAAYSKVRYSSIYPGIDVIYYGNQRQVEFDFAIAPGADPGRIRLAFPAASMRIDPEGNLLLSSRHGELRLHAPLAFQDTAAGRVRVAAAFDLLPGKHVGFRLGAWDRSRPLYIDPVLGFSTYLGGSDDDQGLDIAVDGQGNTYVLGNTVSTNFPTAGAAQRAFGGKGQFAGDVFVVKLNPDGRSLAYATYLGGSGDDRAGGIAVDRQGSAYVTGDTESRNFPTTQGAFRTAYSGGTYDAFVTKLSPSGSMLAYSTFLGGGENDFGKDIAVDSANNAYVAGNTFSGNFPTMNPVQAAFGGRTFDGFVTRLNAAGSGLVYSTFLGGSRNDEAYGIAVDGAGNACIAGYTNSANFPVFRALRSTRVGNYDVFVTKLPPAGAPYTYSTFLGGSRDDFANGVAMDASGNCYVTGFTDSTNFPTMNPFQPTFGGGRADAFLTKFDLTGMALVYSTYLGGSSYDEGWSVAVDANGAALVAGATESANFPTANAIQSQVRGGTREGTPLTRPEDVSTGFGIRLFNVSPDGFLTRYSADGGMMLLSTYLGGAGDDFLFGVATDASGNQYVTGSTTSTDFATATPLQAASAGGRRDAVIAKISDTPAPPTLTNVSAASFRAGALAPDSLVTANGPNLATTTEVPQSTPLPTVLGGTRVTVIDSAGVSRDAALVYVSPTQVNYLMPPGVATGPATVRITAGDGSSISGTVLIEPVAPGLFALSADGIAAAYALRVSADGTQTVENPFRYDEIQQKVVLVPIDPGPESDQVILLLFGTGFRNQRSMAATVGGIDSEVLYGGPQGGFDGLDQANVRLSRRLAGRGEVQVDITADGKKSNSVKLLIGGTAPPLPPPVINTLSPNNGQAGQTVATFTITGENLQSVTGIEFTPPDGITVTNVRATASSVTAQLAIAGSAASEPRQVAVIAPQGRSNALGFTITASTRPSISSVAPTGAAVGQTVETLTIRGEFLEGATAIQFTPAAAITVTNVVATATQVTARIVVALNATIGTRQIAVVTPRGTSNSLPFAIQPPTSATPVIGDVSLTNPTGSTALSTYSGAFTFADGDADIINSGTPGTSARLKFVVTATGGSCTTQFSGSFLHRPGQTNGRITFSNTVVNARITFTGALSVSVSLLDASGKESNVVVVPLTRWYCN